MGDGRPRGVEAVALVRAAILAKCRANDELLRLSCLVTQAQYRKGVTLGRRDHEREQAEQEAATEDISPC